MSGKQVANGSFYDKYWEQDVVPPYLEPLMLAMKRLGILPGAKILDIGCGNGALGEWLIQSFQCEMYGTDVSTVALELAARRGYKVIPADMDTSRSLRLPSFNTRFDVVVLSAVLEHVFDPVMLLEQAFSALKDGGYVVVLTPNVTWFLNRILFALDIWEHPLLGGTPGHIRYLNQKMLERLLQKTGFRELDWSYSPMAVLPPNQDLHVGRRVVPFLRHLVGKRAGRWTSLLAENLIVLGRKPIVTEDARQQARLEPPDRVDKLTVLHIAATANGANWMVDILKGLCARGYDAAAMISGAQGDLAGKLERERIPYFVGELDIFSTLDVFSVIRKVFKLALFLRAHRYDIVHYHLFPSVILGRIAAWLADVPLRFSMITGPFYLEAPASRQFDLRTVWMDSKVITSCNFTRQLYCLYGIPPDRVELIYYGADSSHFDPATADPEVLRRDFGIPAEDPLIGIVAYFYAPFQASPWTPDYLHNRAIKGHDVLIKAVPHVLAQKPNAKFLLVGKGWGAAGELYEKDLRNLVAQMGLSHSVIFTGPRSDIPNVLASFDVSVQCSLNENVGGTIESLLMARPIVATAVGGMVDAVRDGQTGLLVPPDDPKRLAEAILCLLDDPTRGRQLGNRGRELMLKEFTLAKTVDDIDLLYQKSAREIQHRNGSRRLSASRYRIHRTLGRLVILPLDWAKDFFFQDFPQSIHAAMSNVIQLVRSSVRHKRTLTRQGYRLPGNLGTSLGHWVGIIADLLPLLLPFLVLARLLPAPWQVLLLVASAVAFIGYRMLFVGPTIDLIRLLTKRLFDVIFAVVGLFLYSPVWLLIALIIRVDSSGPILVRRRQIGRGGLPFENLRFRVSVHLQVQPGLGNAAQPNRVRMTKAGRLLRALGLERLPELINVLRGEMSIVGPHFDSMGYLKQHSYAQYRRLQVKPGLLSWAWLRGRADFSIADAAELDLWYTDHWSFWLDLYICLRAIPHYGLRLIERMKNPAKC